MPMSVPALASFAIFQFLWVWNDLLVALLFLGRGDNTILTVALQGLQGQTGQGIELIPSAGFVTIIVPLHRLPVPAAVLHPRHDGGGGQGLSHRSTANTVCREPPGFAAYRCPLRLSSSSARSWGSR